ncbi:MAG: hypothetical protein V9G20_26640 [Candidatus Promineifilaceae bacterium]
MDALTIIGIIGIIIGIVAGIVQIVDYLQKQREQRALTTANKSLSAAAPHTDDTPSHLASLHQQLTILFSEGELRNLCFDLGVDYESLPARSKDGKARELIAHMQRNSRLSELITMGRQLRPRYGDHTINGLRTATLCPYNASIPTFRRELCPRQAAANYPPQMLNCD